MKSLDQWEDKCKKFLSGRKQGSTDSAHGLTHVQRVVRNCKTLAAGEEVTLAVLLPAAWLHDCVILPKDHPERKTASALSAERAVAFLRRAGYDPRLFPEIRHAIRAHSYSAGIPPETIEAEILQDADRLDALGAVGLARCLMVGGSLERPLYHPNDPFCKSRKPDDSLWTIDHVYLKLFKLPDLMHTDRAKNIALKRVQRMREFLDNLEEEING